MKKYLVVFAIFIVWGSLSAQAPQGISYQAVVRDGDQQLVKNAVVSVRISILQSTTYSDPIFTEFHNPLTNNNGLISIIIGRGSQQTGDFTIIDWSAGPYYIKTETDPMGGSNFSISSTTQLLSVPYALFATTSATSLNAFSGDYNDLANSPDLESFATKDMQNQNITNLANPHQEMDAANKVYVDHLMISLRDRIQHLEDELGIEPPPMVDYDGNVYQTVRINHRLWINENLKVTHYRNGDPIPNLQSAEEWGNSGSDGYVWYENDYETWGQHYGALYNWKAIINEAGLCPAGWSPAKEADWAELVNYLDQESEPTQWPESEIAGGKLKSTRTAPADDHPRWPDPNAGATNETGFNALPGGWRSGAGLFHSGGTTGFWRVATASPTGAWYRSMVHDSPYLYRSAGTLTAGMSVRCVKN